MNPLTASPAQVGAPTTTLARRRPKAKSRATRAGGAGMGAWCDAVLRDPRLRMLPFRAQVAMHVAIVRWADDNGVFYPTHQTWAEAAGMSVATLRRAIKDLERADLLDHTRCLRQGGYGEGSSTYRILIRPGPWSGEPSDRDGVGEGAIENAGASEPVPGCSPVITQVGHPGATRTETRRTESCFNYGSAAAGAGLPTSEEAAAIERLLGDEAAEILWARGISTLAPGDAIELACFQRADPDSFLAHLEDICETPSVQRPVATLLHRVRTGRTDRDNFPNWSSVHGA